MASLFLFIKKEDGSLQVIQDYRKLNDGTVKNKYLLLLINELINKIKDVKYITKLDVRWGYYNIWIHEVNKWKAAFQMNLELFKPTNKLFLKLQKCEFEVSTIKYLGHIIGNGEVRIDPKKTVAVQEWPVPKNVHELQQFLGLGNWLHHFVEGYSLVVKSLMSLTSKAEWKWGEEEQKAFEELKEQLSSPPGLAIPNNDDPFHVEEDVSDFATRGVLLQKQEGKWKVIAYQSLTLLDAE
ncbi:hypothetical protein ACEPAG_2115 [Sanghuangporus baumii]